VPPLANKGNPLQDPAQTSRLIDMLERISLEQRAGGNNSGRDNATGVAQQQQQPVRRLTPTTIVPPLYPPMMPPPPYMSPYAQPPSNGATDFARHAEQMRLGSAHTGKQLDQQQSPATMRSLLTAAPTPIIGGRMPPPPFPPMMMPPPPPPPNPMMPSLLARVMQQQSMSGGQFVPAQSANALHALMMQQQQQQQYNNVQQQLYNTMRYAQQQRQHLSPTAPNAPPYTGAPYAADPQAVDLAGLTREQIEQLLKAAAIVINRVSVRAYCAQTVVRAYVFSMINSRQTPMARTNCGVPPIQS
jgi:hypothetical protein